MHRQNMLFKALFPLSLLLFLIVTACSDSDSDIDRSAENSQTIVEVSESKLIKEESAFLSAAKVKNNLTDVVLALSVDGLLLINEQSGKTQTIPFDTDIATSITVISSTLGKPTKKFQNDECGAGPMSFITWSNGLTINAIGERFVGWSVRPNTKSANLTTVDNIGLRKTLADLKANYQVEVIQSSLGTEFITSNGLSGLLSANEPDGVITNLWSGIACNFR